MSDHPQEFDGILRSSALPDDQNSKIYGGCCQGMVYSFIANLNILGDDYSFMDSENFLTYGIKLQFHLSEIRHLQRLKKEGKTAVDFHLETKIQFDTTFCIQDRLTPNYCQIDLSLEAIAFALSYASDEIITLTAEHHEICIFANRSSRQFDLYDARFGVARFSNEASAAYVACRILERKKQRAKWLIIGRYRKIPAAEVFEL